MTTTQTPEDNSPPRASKINIDLLNKIMVENAPPRIGCPHTYFNYSLAHGIVRCSDCGANVKLNDDETAQLNELLRSGWADFKRKVHLMRTREGRIELD